MARHGHTSPVKTGTTELATVRGSMVRLRIGRRTYDAVRDPSCAVCIHPGRVQIEERILFNETYPKIVEWVSNIDHERIDGVKVTWPDLTAKQLASHFRRAHCPIDARMLHELTQERDAGMSEGYEKVAKRVVDHMVFADMTIARVQERAVRGEIEPSYKEGLAAAKLKASVEAQAAQVEQVDRTSSLEQAFEIYFATAERIMTPEQWDEFGRDLNRNPHLRALIERMQSPTPDGTEIVDAEIVEHPQ